MLYVFNSITIGCAIAGDRNTRHFNTFSMRMRVRASMSPTMKLLVYYVREDGETVADNIIVDVAHCTQNKVSIILTQYEALQLVNLRSTHTCKHSLFSKKGEYM